jgi:PAS domain S-box-containing protein
MTSEPKGPAVPLDILLEAVTDAVVVLGPDRRVERWCRGAERLYGLSPAETVGRPLDEVLTVIWPEGGGAEARALAALHGPGRWQGRCVHVPHGGRPIRVDTTLARLNGLDSGLLIVAREVTPREEALEALRRSEADVRRVERIAHLGTFVLDTSSARPLVWSPETFRIFGIDPTPHLPALSQYIEHIVHPDDRVTVAEDVARAIELGHPYEHEVRALRPDGTTRWVRVVAAPEHGPDGRVVRLVGTVLDVTERKEAELALEASRHFIERVADSVAVAIYVFDLELQRSVYINPAVTRLFGYTTEEYMAMGTEVPERLLHPDDRPLLDAHLEKLLRAADREVVECEYRMLHKEGRWCRVHARNVVFERAPDGVAVRILGSLEDVTAMRQAENELQRAHERLEERVRERTRDLQSVNAELEAFSYSVSHDLRAPLRVIAADSEQVLEDYADRLDAEGRECLERIVTSVVRMDQMIEGLMRLSHVTRAPLDVQPVDVTALVREIGADLAQREPGRAVALHVPEGLRMDGDPTLLRVVLNNLLQNAWKFTRERAVAEVEVDVTPGPGAPVCSVRDNGVGFDADGQAQLFQAFRRLHGTRFEGTGIGLATVAQAVRRHGGRVWAEGAPGAGATFYFTLGSPRS